MRRRGRCAKGLLAALLLLALPAAGGRSAEPLGPCQGDAKRLCLDAEGGLYGLLRCLSEHRDELDEACRDAISSQSQRTLSRFAKLGQACQGDLERLCPGRRGPLHVVQCLRSHEADLTETCRSALPPRPAAAQPEAAGQPPEADDPRPRAETDS